MPTIPLVNQWANFCQNEKLLSDSTLPDDVVTLMNLCQKLADTGISPYGKNQSHAQRLEKRRLLCQTAFDLGIDLMKIKKRKNQFGGTKSAMGRGLLDIWNEEYAKKYGSNYGTDGAREVIRRTIVTKLTKPEKLVEPEQPE